MRAGSIPLLRMTDEIDVLIEYHHYTTLREYWDVERKYVDEEYRNIPFPFEKKNVPSFTIEYSWTIEELLFCAPGHPANFLG